MRTRSRPSKSGSITRTVPVLSPKPRWSIADDGVAARCGSWRSRWSSASRRSHGPAASADARPARLAQCEASVGLEHLEADGFAAVGRDRDLVAAITAESVPACARGVAATPPPPVPRPARCRARRRRRRRWRRHGVGPRPPACAVAVPSARRPSTSASTVRAIGHAVGIAVSRARWLAAALAASARSDGPAVELDRAVTSTSAPSLRRKCAFWQRPETFLRASRRADRGPARGGTLSIGGICAARVVPDAPARRPAACAGVGVVERLEAEAAASRRDGAGLAA